MTLSGHDDDDADNNNDCNKCYEHLLLLRRLRRQKPQVMARLGVTQKERLMRPTPTGGANRPAPREFAPAVVVDARRGGQYYSIRCGRHHEQ